ncbi:unnamed protein product, partial [Adineta steineri]
RTFYHFNDQDYETLIERHNARHLFKDQTFGNKKSSLGYTPQFLEKFRDVIWKRPYEICENPQFIVNGANKHDPDQGRLGNCWFIAAVSLITQNRIVFERVCPDQTFNQGFYAGIIFGYIWIDIVVDDYLPTVDDHLILCRNKQEEHEFWIALLEKAYAKLYGSYESLKGGIITEALVDMTGGIGELFYMEDIMNNDLFWQTINTALNHGAMIGCSSLKGKTEHESRFSNGLIGKHAYAVTDATVLKCEDGEVVKLVCCRNPWGTKDEWIGDWCDRDEINWNRVHWKKRQELYHKKPDGEFWISYFDWLSNFRKVGICHLLPGLLESRSNDRSKNYIPWHQAQYNGNWTTGPPASGRRNFEIEDFLKDPQYLIDVAKMDSDHDDGLCTVICTCLQKHTRQTGGQGAENYIRLQLYRIKDAVVDTRKIQDDKFYLTDLKRQRNEESSTGRREVTVTFRVKPGYYILIPSIRDKDRKGEFFIRIFTESAPRGRSSITRPLSIPSAGLIDSDDEENSDDEQLYVRRFQKNNEQQSEVERKEDVQRQERMNKYQGVNLYIKNLDDTIDDGRLRKEFSKFGTIYSATIMSKNGRSKGFGFVCFSAPDEATKAVTEMNGSIVGSKPLYVAIDQSKEERRMHLTNQHMQRIATSRVPPQMQLPFPNGMGGMMSYLPTPMSPSQPRNFFPPTAMPSYRPAQPRWSSTATAGGMRPQGGPQMIGMQMQQSAMAAQRSAAMANSTPRQGMPMGTRPIPASRQMMGTNSTP